MRIGRRETRRRLINFTLPTVLGTGGGGVTFDIEQGDRSRARSVLYFLENRRVLYAPYDVERTPVCFDSVKEIREHLAAVIPECESPELRDPLRAIQAACRQYLTEIQAIEAQGLSLDINRNGAGSWLVNQAVGALRARVGTNVAIIVATFDIDVDEHLAPIMPPPLDEGDSERPQLEGNQPSSQE